MQTILAGSDLGLVTFSATSPEVRFFAHIVLCGMAAGVIGTTAIIYRVYLSFMPPMVLPVIFTKLFFNHDYFQFSQNTLGCSSYMLSPSRYLLTLIMNIFKESIELKAKNKTLLNNETHTLKNRDRKSNLLSKKPESIIDDANKITTAGKNILPSIKDVLDLSKIEAGRMNVFIEEINIYHFLNSIKESIKILIEQNKNTFIFDISNDLTTIQSDSTKLRQILYNIIGNAEKFTSHGQVILKQQTQKKILSSLFLTPVLE